jgi:hypothetical protein
MHRVLLLAVLLLGFGPAFSQTTRSRYSEKDYARRPLWATMMDDPGANFFEVEKAFTIYWQHHEKPEGEHDVIGERREREKTPSRRAQRRIQRDNELRMAVKRYERWHQKTEPFVQPDGRILTPEERLRIHAAQRGQ